MSKAKKTTAETDETLPQDESVNESTQQEEEIATPEVELKESDEILFLRNLLSIQHGGGWGHNLDEIIYNRIKELQS